MKISEVQKDRKFILKTGPRYPGKPKYFKTTSGGFYPDFNMFTKKFPKSEGWMYFKKHGNFYGLQLTDDKTQAEAMTDADFRYYCGYYPALHKVNGYFEKVFINKLKESDDVEGYILKTGPRWMGQKGYIETDAYYGENFLDRARAFQSWGSKPGSLIKLKNPNCYVVIHLTNDIAKARPYNIAHFFMSPYRQKLVDKGYFEKVPISKTIESFDDN